MKKNLIHTLSMVALFAAGQAYAAPKRTTSNKAGDFAGGLAGGFVKSLTGGGAGVPGITAGDITFDPTLVDVTTTKAQQRQAIEAASGNVQSIKTAEGSQAGITGGGVSVQAGQTQNVGVNKTRGKSGGDNIKSKSRGGNRRGN